MTKRDFLAQVARMVRIDGRYVRKGKDHVGTAETAYWTEIEPKDDNRPSADDFQTADDALAYAAAIGDDASKYTRSVRDACAKSGDVEFRSSNLIGAILEIAVRGQSDTEFQELGAGSVHVNKPAGSEITYPRVNVVQMRTIPMGRFERNIVKFLTPDGDILTWWASTMPNVRIGETVRFSGRVKGPSEYQGVKETLVTRCQCPKIPA